MWVKESKEFHLQMIMDEYDLDESEARDFLTDLEDDADYVEEHDERIGLGDCYGDAL